MVSDDKSKKIDFIGIGAPKSGSTWIGKCLEEHPDILFSSQKVRKELHFFNVDNVWGDNSTGNMSYYSKGLDWYLKQFPDAEEGKVRGEFCIAYMADPEAYKRMKDAFPNVKILATLRNPVDMVYSLHWYFYFGAVLDVPKDFFQSLEKGLFVEKGFYYKHLKNFFDNFPKENIHITLHDDIIRDPKKTIQDIYAFLGVDSTFVPPSLSVRVNKAFQTRFSLIKNVVHYTLKLIDTLGLDSLRMHIFESKNLQKIYTLINKTYKKYPVMDDETRKKCYDMYAEDIENLEKLLNLDLSAWKVQ